MALENTKFDIVSESPKKPPQIDSQTLADIFGKPPLANKTDGFEMINKNHDNHISDNNKTDLSLPLLEPDRDKQKPPLAGPEMDDLGDEKPANGPYSGIDDGLLAPSDDKPHFVDVDDLGDEHSELESRAGAGDTEDGKWPWMGGDEPDYPYDGQLQPKFDDRPISPAPTSIDVNTYQQKKNLAQGMMDLALLSANANQLRYVLESRSTHPYYYPSLVFISLSILFQIAVGVGLIMNSRYDVNDKKEICKADKINNFTVLGIFLITIVNVFITSFSVATQAVPV